MQRNASLRCREAEPGSKGFRDAEQLDREGRRSWGTGIARQSLCPREAIVRGNVICFPHKKAHFFSLPLPFTTSLRNSYENQTLPENYATFGVSVTS